MLFPEVMHSSLLCLLILPLALVCDADDDDDDRTPTRLFEGFDASSFNSLSDGRRMRSPYEPIPVLNELEPGPGPPE